MNKLNRQQEERMSRPDADEVEVSANDNSSVCTVVVERKHFTGTKCGCGLRSREPIAACWNVLLALSKLSTTS